MLKIVQAPNELAVTGKKLFLGGGITGCRDWQSEAIEKLADLPLTIFNPRREFCPENAEEQIAWEWKALRASDAISFWFSSETIQPITLLELGRWTAYTEPGLELGFCNTLQLKMKRKKLFVGVDPAYSRKQDIAIQLKLQCPDQKIVTSIEDLCLEIREWCQCG